jgi:hypothetical protein
MPIPCIYKSPTSRISCICKLNRMRIRVRVRRHGASPSNERMTPSRDASYHHENRTKTAPSPPANRSLGASPGPGSRSVALGSWCLYAVCASSSKHRTRCLYSEKKREIEMHVCSMYYEEVCKGLQACLYVCTHAHLRTHACARAYTHMHIHTHTHTALCLFTSMHAFPCSCTTMCMCVYVCVYSISA